MAVRVLLLSADDAIIKDMMMPDSRQYITVAVSNRNMFAKMLEAEDDPTVNIPNYTAVEFRIQPTESVWYQLLYDDPNVWVYRAD